MSTTTWDPQLSQQHLGWRIDGNDYERQTTRDPDRQSHRNTGDKHALHVYGHHVSDEAASEPDRMICPIIFRSINASNPVTDHIHGVYEEIAKQPLAFLAQPPGRAEVLANQVFFGIGTTWEILEAYGRAHGMVDKSTVITSYKVVERLSELCQERLRLRPVTSPDHDVVISLYSNYTMWHKELEDPDENEVLDCIRTELGINGEKPMWFHIR